MGYDYAYAVITATGGAGSYRCRLDNTGRWQTSNTLQHIPSGPHYAFVKDAFNQVASVPFAVAGTATPCSLETFEK